MLAFAQNSKHLIGKSKGQDIAIIEQKLIKDHPELIFINQDILAWN